MTDRNRIKKPNLALRVICILLFIILFPVILIWLVIRLVKKITGKKQEISRVRIFKITQIDTLTGVEFEDFLKTLFETMGYVAETTKTTGDYGADLVVTKNRKRGVVQAKRYSKTVGVAAVQQIIGAKNHYGASMAFVATNNYFSAEARSLALENDVNLIDRDVLEKLILKCNITVKRRANGFSALEKERVLEIERRFPNWI